MNKFQKIGVAIAFASSMVFAGDPLWWNGIEHGQVTFPWIFDCKYGPNANFHEDDSNDPCFKTMGGWWFGTVYGPSVEANADTYQCGTSKTRKSGTNKVMVKNLKGGEKSLNGADFPSCEGPDVTDRATGISQLDGDFLHVEFTIGEGDYSKYAPDGVSLAVGLSTPSDPHVPVLVKRDMTQYSRGFCLEYTSDHDAGSSANGSNGHDVALELDWNNLTPPPDGDPIYDTWVHYLAPAATPTVVNMSWEGTLDQKACYTSNKQGDFSQDNWAGCDGNTSRQPNPAGNLDKAAKELAQIAIRLKGYEPKTVNFKLYKFGFYGDCGASNPNPIIVKNASNVNLTVNGKVLTASIAKPAVIQVYNLQGAMVKSQTLTPNSNTMNLTSLPTGIYMVRAPSLGYTGRIVIK
ncbi:MAG: T9SS type A sorting domain-containing protein [Fibromonadaceae bacterium]|jgi:hypothetical protein|nr:T9SS type A sorting domain-containing protein [Fibromonadaceae bacterium]